MRFVLFSDLHLDTPFSWAQPAVARARRQGIRDTLQAIVQLAEDVSADAILCGGDLYEHERITPDTAAFLRTCFGDAGRPVVAAPGNHDWVGPESPYVQVDWPDNVHVFTEDRLVPLDLADGLTLWGAAHRAPANTDGFFDRGFSTDRGGVNLALFHGSERSRMPFEPERKAPHAPFAAQQVRDAGLDHAFLGHLHTPAEADVYTYPGNPYPLTFGEKGTRGAVVIDVAPNGSVTREWHDVATSQAHDVAVDVTGCASLQDVRQRAAAQLAGKSGVARLTISGDLDPAVDLHAVTDLALANLPRGLSLEALVVRKGSLNLAYDLEVLKAEPTVRGQFVRDVLAVDLDEEERQRVLTVGLRALDGRDDLEVA